ncbi:MAG: UDP-2,3-diacylglucosamine diphosphatase LpxI [Paracoccaceae bacterium]
MLAIVAGEGELPVLLHRHMLEHGEPPLIVELDGFPSRIKSATPIRFRVEHLGSLLADLKAQGVTELCLAGRVQRPKLDPTAVDAATEPFVPGITAAISAGDDGALREILFIIEEFGFQLRAVHELMPDLLPALGVPTVAKPGERDRDDALRAVEILDALGHADIGQACVVAAGQALAVEALGGTDWMLASLAGKRRPKGPTGGILFKAPKPGQDRRADLPVIGPDTVAGVKAAGLSGIVIEEDGVIVLDAAATVAAADADGLFIWVRDTP